ncbi:hypothetical protein [Sulfitobacter aestuariivivens]|uniref:Uncharacterized protein n=1 Tax=Sulfitobacter aestuariivivens TaxID=2766981 RepID=A0A927D3Z4_9RHOB|nr:hypothetical protein [Sulfitobacter aestuariivivens]MBD3664725.1 hypothetical protein [Sulfitobacter aestuariivivens]
MGPVRGGLILSLAPLPALAEVCDKVRPLWQAGSPATAWDELVGLMATPPSLALLLASALVIRFRHQWTALIVVVLWSFWVSAVAHYGRDGEIERAALAEGCIGSPALFILAVTAICGAMILYTTRRPARPSD